MQISFEDYKKQPRIADREEWMHQFYYIIGVSQNEGYEEAINYISPFLRHEDIKIQRAAMQGLDMLAGRFMNTSEEALFMLLENLKSENKKILSQTFTTLEAIAQFVLKFKQRIYLSFFENGFDFYTNKKLKKHTNVKELASLNKIEDKEEFILSFCQHSSNYDETFSVCLNFLQKDKHEELSIAAIRGLNYLVIKFEKIESTLIMPYIKRFLKDFFCFGYTDTEYLLVNIAYYIPALKPQAIEMLESIESSYIEMYKLKDNV